MQHVEWSRVPEFTIHGAQGENISLSIANEVSTYAKENFFINGRVFSLNV